MEDKINVLIPQEELETRIREMAAQISKDYEGESLHLVCVLRGSIFFTCELAKYITVPTHAEFGKNAPTKSDITGSFAPQGIKEVVIIVIRRSRSHSMVREAIIPGTLHPVPTSIGMKDLPERPNFLNMRSITKAIRDI